MKRTNLVLDEKLLAEAQKLLGLRTYSETVNQALKELVRSKHLEGLHQFMGSNLWQGDLDEMRQDRFRRPVSRKRAAR